MTRARLLAVTLLVIGGLAAAWPGAASAVSLPPGFQDETVFEGLEEPTSFRFAPDGRVFVAEKQGKILVYDSLEDATPTVFADLRTEAYDNGDRGLLSIVLDPNFAEHPYVYALYTYDHLLGEAAPAPKWGTPNQAGDPCPKPDNADVDACPVSGRLVRLTAVGDHAKELEGGGGVAEKVLVEDWCQQFSSHSIGDLQFGPEGALFASGGDGASFNSTDYGQFGWPQKNQCGDPPGVVGEELTPPTAEGGALRAQNTENLDGSVIRVNPETGEGLPSNPMASSLNANTRRIIAYGFRNPFRFAIDPESDEVYVGNVGWNSYEEIDRFSTVPNPAFNSGWPCYEGPIKAFDYRLLELDVCEALYNTPGSTAPPLFSYSHYTTVTPEDTCNINEGSGVAGLDIYEGAAFPAAFKGALFFSDFVRRCIYVMFPGEDGRPDPSTTVPFMTEGGVYPAIDVEEGPEGNLFYVKLFNEAFGPGSIHRISYSSGNQPPVAHLTVDNRWGATPLVTHFDASSSTDDDGEALSFEWDLNGTGAFAPGAGTATKTFSDEENHTVAVRVKDGHGASSIARVTVYPGDTPPEPEILEPAEASPGSGVAELEWHVGQPIHFVGAAEDSEDGPLAATSLGWNSRLYHCPSGCHVHPLQAFPAVDSGTLIAPDHDYPSLIELTLTATDSRGLAVSKGIKINAHPVQLAIASEPPGVTLNAGQSTKPAPFSLTAIEDSNISLAAPRTAEVGGKTYLWSGWSDGGARVHTIVASDLAAYTAFYTVTKGPGAAPGPGGGAVYPETLLLGHPDKKTRRTVARFVFSSSELNSSFRCRLDKDPYRPCRSPHLYRHLQAGRHLFQVAAVDGRGAIDPTSASFRWSVLCPTRQPAGCARRGGGGGRSSR